VETGHIFGNWSVVNSAVLPTEALTIPNNLAPGTYTVRLTIDPNNQVAESDEGNNTFDIPQSLTIVTP
jgi:subtilase family serine protease